MKSTKNIRCANQKSAAVLEEGMHTCLRFDDLPEDESSAAAGAPSPPRSKLRQKKRRVEQIHSAINDTNVPVHDLMLSGSSLQAAVQVGLHVARESAPVDTIIRSTSSDETSAPQAEQLGLYYKKLYDELKEHHEQLKEHHEGLQKEHEGLQKRYQEKRDYKKIAKEYVEKSEKLEKLLDIERTRRKEELEEKDEDLERLEKRNSRLEERIKSLDSIHASSLQRNVQVGSGTRQVTL